MYNLVTLTIGLLVLFGAHGVYALDAGDRAPDFELFDQHGNAHHIDDYRGNWLVLYFYPKDDTPGCTTEACAFRDEYRLITALNTKVLGVSVDSAESHARFAKKFSLPFPLLSDAGGLVAKQFGSLDATGATAMAKRHTFIIDPQGFIAKIYRSVDPKIHAQQVIADLHSLQLQE